MSFQHNLLAGLAIIGTIVHVQPSAAANPPAKTGVDSVGQSWAITIAWNLPQDRLPKTNDMKMASFDSATYIERACVDGWQEGRCDLYVQPDIDGSLMGYLIIEQYKGRLSFKTDTMTTSTPAHVRSCTIGGSLTGGAIDDAGNYKVIEELDPTGNWEARSPFETKSSMGMMYVKKVGDKLRVNDERWNYCYPDRHIDDVYFYVGSMVRKLDPSRWPTPPK
jgi:hypothetical protein